MQEKITQHRNTCHSLIQTNLQDEERQEKEQPFGGIHGLLKTDVWVRTIKFIVLSPLIGMLLRFSLMVLVHWIFKRATPKRVDNFFRKGQLFSATAFSLGHGGQYEDCPSECNLNHI